MFEGLFLGVIAVIVGSIGYVIYKSRVKKTPLETFKLAREHAEWIERDVIGREELASRMTDDEKRQLRDAESAYYMLPTRQRTIEALDQAIQDKQRMLESES